MTLDVMFLGLALIMVYLGWRSGVTGQVLRVVAAISVFFLTAPVSGILRDAWFGDQAVASPGIEVASMFLSAVVVYIGVTLLGNLVIGLMRKTSETLSGLDRVGGVALGGIKALLIVYVLAVCASFLYGPLERVDPKDSMHLRDGQATAFVEEYDVLAPWRFPHVGELQSAIRVAELAQRSERARREIRTHASAADFIRTDAFKALMKRAQLVKAARQDRYAVVLADASVREFLNRPEQVEVLEKIDWVRVEEDLGVKKEPRTPILDEVVEGVEGAVEGVKEGA